MSEPHSESDGRRARREAAAWLSRHDRGLTAAEQDEFLQWLAADASHRAWLTRHRSGWERLDGLAGWRPRDGVEPDPDILARPRRRPSGAAVAAIALAAAFVLAAMFLAPASRVVPPTAPVAIAGVPGYERRQLEDGSVVELNSGAEIEVHTSARERRVVLRRGEALFTVARDPARPFVVRARGVDVRAVGTVFNVRLESARVEVLVTEGKVSISPPPAATVAPATAAAPLVAAGERAVVPLQPAAVPEIALATAADLERLKAWQPCQLDFSSVPLGDAIAELNRRNRVQIRLLDPASARLPVVARIRSDNVDGFVRLIAPAAGLIAEAHGDYEIALRRAR